MAGSQPTKAATGQQASNAPEVPPKLVLAPLAPASPPLVGGGAGSEAATATAKSLAGCNMVGWGNNEDGQLVPAGPAHSGSMTEVGTVFPHVLLSTQSKDNRARSLYIYLFLASLNIYNRPM